MLHVFYSPNGVRFIYIRRGQLELFTAKTRIKQRRTSSALATVYRHMFACLLHWITPAFSASRVLIVYFTFHSRKLNAPLTQLRPNMALERSFWMTQSLKIQMSRMELTNRPDFFKFCTLIDHRNDAIKCSKLSHFTAKFLTFYGVISMVWKSADHEKVWLIRFLTITRKVFSGISFTFRCEIVNTKSAHVLRCISRHFHGLYSHRP